MLDLSDKKQPCLMKEITQGAWERPLKLPTQNKQKTTPVKDKNFTYRMIPRVMTPPILGNKLPR